LNPQFWSYFCNQNKFWSYFINSAKPNFHPSLSFVPRSCVVSFNYGQNNIKKQLHICTTLKNFMEYVCAVFANEWMLHIICLIRNGILCNKVSVQSGSHSKLQIVICFWTVLVNCCLYKCICLNKLHNHMAAWQDYSIIPYLSFTFMNPNQRRTTTLLGSISAVALRLQEYMSFKKLNFTWD
jgi:Na+/H+ antiporter NhaA